MTEPAQRAESVATESRARRRIRQAVERRGYTLVKLDWEPWYDAGEKSGIGGGWYGETDRPYLRNTWPGNEIMGLSVEETLAWVDEFVPTPEPCDCPPVEYPGPLQSQVPTWVHAPECRWHIRYWMRWWPARIDGCQGSAK